MSHIKFRVANRHDNVASEKCPRCLNVFMHFMDLGGGLDGCYKCGSVFVSKPVRDFNYSRVMEQLKEQMATPLVDPIMGPAVVKEAEKVRWLCSYSGCRFEAKSKAGLAAHQRRCKNANNT